MSAPHTLLLYRYRDASNFKANGEILLSGTATPELRSRLCSSLLDGEYFIPEKVGLPSLREQLYAYSDGIPTDDDHLVHEFVELREALPAESTTLAVTANLVELVAQFEAHARRGWWSDISALMDQLDLPLQSRISHLPPLPHPLHPEPHPHRTGAPEGEGAPHPAPAGAPGRRSWGAAPSGGEGVLKGVSAPVRRLEQRAGHTIPWAWPVADRGYWANAQEFCCVRANFTN